MRTVVEEEATSLARAFRSTILAPGEPVASWPLTSEVDMLRQAGCSVEGSRNHRGPRVVGWRAEGQPMGPCLCIERSRGRIEVERGGERGGRANGGEKSVRETAMKLKVGRSEVGLESVDWTPRQILAGLVPVEDGGIVPCRGSGCVVAVAAAVGTARSASSRLPTG